MGSVPLLKTPIITLTTDFGLTDYFVGSMKGVLLQQIPSAKLIDISHNIARHDIISGAFVINESYRYFPPATIHLVVVDPGVGTSRRKIIAKYKDHLFVAPDNGLLTYILKEKGCHVFEVLEKPFLKFKKSPTFAGRDHFAPIAALLAKGILPIDFGKKIFDSHQISALCYEKEADKLIGKIIYFDHFGNAISNLTQNILKRHLTASDTFTASINGKSLKGIKKNYREGEGKGGNLLINSSGHLEIFTLMGSAKKMLKLNLMDNIVVYKKIITY